MDEKLVDRATRALEAPAIPNTLAPELAVDLGRRDGPKVFRVRAASHARSCAPVLSGWLAGEGVKETRRDKVQYRTEAERNHLSHRQRDHHSLLGRGPPLGQHPVRHQTPAGIARGDAHESWELQAPGETKKEIPRITAISLPGRGTGAGTLRALIGPDAGLVQLHGSLPTGEMDNEAPSFSTPASLRDPEDEDPRVNPRTTSHGQRDQKGGRLARPKDRSPPWLTRRGEGQKGLGPVSPGKTRRRTHHWGPGIMVVTRDQSLCDPGRR
ncbi:hypothetical protein GQ53DRAFT_764933 [Thozetella sp. PMI_491]|nr:hypothetical protein GQ53DRAFT_764933 [Thozetella sp. PMI_491]